MQDNVFGVSQTPWSCEKFIESQVATFFDCIAYTQGQLKGDLKRLLPVCHRSRGRVASRLKGEKGEPAMDSPDTVNSSW